MNSVVLCEGASDAILLSYYLTHTGSWQFISEDIPFGVKLLHIETQEFNWYRRHGDFAAIWGVGGSGMFENAINQLAEINKRTEKEHGVQKIIILTDRDTTTSEQSIIDRFNTHFRNAGITISLQHRTWTGTRCLDAFQEEYEIHVGLIIIPFDRSGALETFVLDVLSENIEDKTVIDGVRMLIADMKDSKYLEHDRQRVKAELAASLGIMYPTRTFKPINSMLSSIGWHHYETIQSGFSLLNDL